MASGQDLLPGQRAAEMTSTSTDTVISSAIQWMLSGTRRCITGLNTRICSLIPSDILSLSNPTLAFVIVREEEEEGVGGEEKRREERREERQLQCACFHSIYYPFIDWLNRLGLIWRGVDGQGQAWLVPRRGPEIGSLCCGCGADSVQRVTVLSCTEKKS